MTNIIKSLARRHSAILTLCAVALVTFTSTRIVLLASHFGEIATPYTIPLALLAGLAFDLLACAVIAVVPALVGLLITARGMGRQWFGRFAVFVSALAIFGLLYLGVSEFYFFQEFTARLNYIAVDYLIFHHEVFVNIRDTYPVYTVISICAVLTALSLIFIGPKIRRELRIKTQWRHRALFAISIVMVVLATFRFLHRDTTRVTEDRTLNEIAGNGLCSFINAALSSELSYPDYYATIAANEGNVRLRRQLTTTQTSSNEPGSASGVERRIISSHPQRKLNVVMVLEESFGSEFVGALYPQGKQCTPCFDSLCGKGTLFTNLYATGNRTVRGLESALLSFPPIPGQSVVRRPLGENLFSLSSLLGSFGYQTVFIYGGRGYFDNVEHFASHNGYDDVIDQGDLPIETFSTIWGVCDEDLFTNSIGVFDSLSATGRPFFATLLTVSNHSPFLYPEGKIPFDPGQQRRENAVRYADYAIGKFIRDAKSHSFFDSTLFVFFGDHGARVYGSQQIPLKSYEIPVLFYGPSVMDSGMQVNRLASQMDIAPTILDILGHEYESQFFGRSMLRSDTGNDWALMSHNRDVSLLRNDTLVVLGIQRAIDVYRVDLKTGTQVRLNVSENTEIIHDAISWYQIAFEMYSEQAFRPPKRQ